MTSTTQTAPGVYTVTGDGSAVLGTVASGPSGYVATNASGKVLGTGYQSVGAAITALLGG